MHEDLNRLLQDDISQYQHKLLSVLNHLTQNPMKTEWLDEGLLITHTLKALAAVRGLPEMEQVSAQLEQVFTQAKALPIVAAEVTLTGAFSKLYDQLVHVNPRQGASWHSRQTHQFLSALVDKIQAQEKQLPAEKPKSHLKKDSSAGYVALQDLFQTFLPWLGCLQNTTQKQYQVLCKTESNIEITHALCQSLQRVLAHLLRNAVYHGIEPLNMRSTMNKPTKGTIELLAEVENGELVVSVTDDGKGMVENKPHDPENEDPHEPIIALGAAPEESDEQDLYSGLGVGLHIVRSEVSRLNGQFEIRSIPGKGTAAVVILPSSTQWMG